MTLHISNQSRMKAFLLRSGSAVLILMLLAALFPASAQEKQPGSKPVLIKNGRIITLTGRDMPKGSILIRKGKIAAVGELVRAPRNATVIDAAGKVVLPGFVDANSALFRDGGGGVKVDGNILDAVNLFVPGAMDSALERGVTTVALFPSPGAGISGRGAALSLVPDADVEAMTLKGDLGLRASLGLGSYGRPIGRLREVQQLRKALKGAKAYEKSLETYEEELEEYVKKLEERAEKKKDENGKKNGKKAEKKEEKKEEKGGKEGEKKKEEELKKPKKPRRDVNKEWLVKALDGDIPLFLEVHRAADILNVLEVVEEYPVRLVIVGATESYMVADALADAGVPVVLGPVQRTLSREANEYRNHSTGCAAALMKAGVPVVLASSGRLSSETRFLSLNAAAAVAGGFCPCKALSAITIDSARILGIDDRVGSLEKGKDADIVIMSGEPLSSSSLVETVLVKGEIAFKRDS